MSLWSRVCPSYTLVLHIFLTAFSSDIYPKMCIHTIAADVHTGCWRCSVLSCSSPKYVEIANYYIVAIIARQKKYWVEGSNSLIYSILPLLTAPHLLIQYCWTALCALEKPNSLKTSNLVPDKYAFNYFYQPQTLVFLESYFCH